MLISAVTPDDRYAAAHQHFSSSGLDIKKVILLGVLICIAVFFTYMAIRKNDEDD